MVRVFVLDEITHALHQRQVEIINCEIRKHLFLGEIGLLTHIQLGYLCGIVVGIDIGITNTIIGYLIVGVDL